MNLIINFCNFLNNHKATNNIYSLIKLVQHKIKIIIKSLVTKDCLMWHKQEN